MKKRKVCGFKGKTLECPFGPFNGKRTFLPSLCSKILHDFGTCGRNPSDLLSLEERNPAN